MGSGNVQTEIMKCTSPTLQQKHIGGHFFRAGGLDAARSLSLTYFYATSAALDRAQPALSGL